MKEIELAHNLQQIYQDIKRAETILRKTLPTEKEQKQIPTERSLYMMYSYALINSRCPSVLLPYLYNQFQNKQSFDVFCTSLVVPSEKPTKKELLQSDVLIRAFIEDNENNEEVDIHPSVLIEDQETDKDVEIEIEMEEIEEPVKKTQFITFPSFPTPSSSNVLDEDILSFINQIPGYGTYSIVCLKTIC